MMNGGVFNLFPGARENEDKFVEEDFIFIVGDHDDVLKVGVEHDLLLLMLGDVL
jgi:hypothetical protein